MSAAAAPDADEGVTIWHNPACGTSRKVLAAIRAAGIEPRVVEYLKTPPSAEEIRDACARMDIAPRNLLRRKAPEFAVMELDQPGLSSRAAIEAMVKAPALIERPVVLAPGGARLCRPAELVAEIVPGAVVKG
ncbi:arsenate reductase (glutaredoxin) [Roseomonas gilardii subsp. gilardii]|uniref:arsenate reductase (glutaredoxin) n=1 Tax=Roseomonas gilardii TaxID=257708 RepID=UPI001FF8CFAF|nr:arsenate reductase (glutaredoxin) [Roseomonas gilardii]UPG72457.1 arsenate reductase (glutaredoxin) [Roseomonas gilardii subsp. gilardii]